MTEPKILVVGDIITDIIVMPEGPMVRGSDRRATIRSRPGGSAANHAVWLGKLGINVTFVVARRRRRPRQPALPISARAVSTPLLAGDPDLPSGVLISIVDSDGERSFLTDRGANLNLSAADLPVSLLDGIEPAGGLRLLLLHRRSAGRGDGAAEGGARAARFATAVDPASVGFLREVGPESFLKWTQGTGTIFANLDEALELTGSVDLEPPDADARAVLRSRGDQARRGGCGGRRPKGRDAVDAGADQRCDRHDGCR